MKKDQKDRDNLYELFRYHQYVIGTTETSLLALRALATAVEQLKCSRDSLQIQIRELFVTIKDSRPKLVILVNAIRLLETDIEDNQIFEKEDADEIKSAIVTCIKRYFSILSGKIDELVDHGVDQIDDGDTIIVHSVNEPVQRIIPAAKRCGKEFQVLILRQDPRKTAQIMRYMQDEGIEFIVTPEYELAHSAALADKLFLGAVAMTGDNMVVCAAGTSNIVGIAKLHDLPTYLFINSLKVSHLPSAEHNINEKERVCIHDDTEYTEISYSHDLVDISAIDHVFTENGEIGRKQIRQYQDVSTVNIILDSSTFQPMTVDSQSSDEE